MTDIRLDWETEFDESGLLWNNEDLATFSALEIEEGRSASLLHEKGIDWVFDLDNSWKHHIEIFLELISI